ncbi:MAG: lysylphosphatidylglycerol synthase transmembrane domain-containing protein [Anaerolineae bacterium]
MAAPPVRRAPLRRAIEIGVSVAFLALALRGVHLEDLWQALQHASYGWLAPAVLATVLTLAIKAWRWQLLFRPEYQPRFGAVFTALSAGYLASNVLPARLGEVISVVLLIGEEPVSAARALSTLIVTRLLDLLTLLAILVGLLPFVQLPAEMTTAAQGLGLAALLASGLIVFLSFRRAALVDMAQRAFRHVRLLDRPGVYAGLGHLLDGFATLRRRSGIVLVGVTLIAWASVIAAAWSCAQAFHLRVPLTAVIFANIVVALGMLVPSSPGYVGVFHYLVIVALAAFGVSKELALGYAIIWHGMNYLTLSATGGAALAIHGTSLGQVLRLWQGDRAPR